MGSPNICKFLDKQDSYHLQKITQTQQGQSPIPPKQLSQTYIFALKSLLLIIENCIIHHKSALKKEY